jgi:hypothetical protein
LTLGTLNCLSTVIHMYVMCRYIGTYLPLIVKWENGSYIYTYTKRPLNAPNGLEKIPNGHKIYQSCPFRGLEKYQN